MVVMAGREKKVFANLDEATVLADFCIFLALYQHIHGLIIRDLSLLPFRIEYECEGSDLDTQVHEAIYMCWYRLRRQSRQ